MHNAEVKMEIASNHKQLNEPQKRHLAATCKYIDSLLTDVESALHPSASVSLFNRYVMDVTPAQILAIEAHIHSLRAHLARILDELRIIPEQPKLAITQLVLTDFSFINAAVEELMPRFMRGYGAIPDDAMKELNDMVQQIQVLVRSAECDLRQNLGMPERSTIFADHKNREA
jgi:hypothetical protein